MTDKGVCGGAANSLYKTIKPLIMSGTVNPILGIIKYAFWATTLLILSSCVYDDQDDCPVDPVTEVRQLLYLRTSDGLTRGDITDTQELDDIMVYLFDRNEKLVDTLIYTTTMMRQWQPIDLTERNLEGGYVSVWANLGDAVETDHADMGDDIDDLEVRMLPNTGRADYYLCPGDIFFGYKKVALTPVDQFTEADTVWLNRKNSRLHITVRGMTKVQNASDYYFNIGAIYSAYDFEGTPQPVARNIWELGEFDDNNDFVSPAPYEMIHNAPDHIYSENSKVVVQLYKHGAAGVDTLIAGSDMDETGQYIKLEQGKTSNVLIILNEETGEVEVQTAITPWDEIHQWTKW